VKTVKPRKLSRLQKPPKQGGMGFVEVLVASAILALTVAGSVTLLGGWTQALSETRNRTDALVRLVSVMDLGKHEIALVNPNDPNYNASLLTGVVSPTQRISGFTVGDITTVAGVNRTKFEASITWLNPYESGANANSTFELHSYHPERRGFVSVSSLTAPVCVGASCSSVDDECIVSQGSKKGKGKSTKSDGTACNTTSKSKSSKSVTYKNDNSNSNSTSCTSTSQTVTIVGYPNSLTVGGSSQQLTATGGGSTNDITFQSLTKNKCTVSGSQVSPVDEGSCIVKAVQAGLNCTFAEGSDQKAITIGCPAFNPLSFSGLQTSDIIDNSVTVNGSNVSGGSTFSPSQYNIGASGACSLSGTTLTYGPSTGTCTVTATQTGVCTSGVQGISIGITVEGEVCEALYGTYVDSKGKAEEGYYLPDTTACQCYSVSSKSGNLKSATGKSQKAQCPAAKTKSEKYP
jgi:hypothetical protein